MKFTAFCKQKTKIVSKGPFCVKMCQKKLAALQNNYHGARVGVILASFYAADVG